MYQNAARVIAYSTLKSMLMLPVMEGRAELLGMKFSSGRLGVKSKV